jgi:hypothetical protein
MEKVLRILHLEDSPDDAGLIDYVLKKSRIAYESLVVSNSEDYIKAIDSYFPDLILSDHSMGQFDSMEALRIFKEKKLNIPFILVTGAVSEEFAVKILKEGAADYLLKDNLVRLPNAIERSLKEKQTEKEKESANQNLELLNKNLEAKCNELSTLMYRLSHDLKGPVTSTAGLINISKSEVKDEVAVKYLKMIEQSNNNLDKILNGLIELVKTDSMARMNDKIDFNLLCDAIIPFYKNNPDTSDVEFKTDISIKKDFYSNEAAIQSIIYNLVSNAVNYRRSFNPFVAITIKEGMESVIISIKDNGVGIAKEFHENIFNMFFKANNNSKGSGLGLYIVKNIVEKLGGKIQLKSEPKNGTEFIIQLPIRSN